MVILFYVKKEVAMHNLKKFVSSLVVGLIVGSSFLCVNAASEGIKIDAEHFPDIGFRNVVKVLDVDESGYLDEYERAQFTTLNLDGDVLAKESFAPIKSLEGIKYFTNLQRLFCPHNQISEIKKGTLPKSVNYLDCTYNNMTSLDLSDLPDLVVLHAYGNKLTSVNYPSSIKAKMTGKVEKLERKYNGVSYPVLAYSEREVVIDSALRNDDQVIIQVSVVGRGTITGEGAYNKGDTVTLTAEAEDYYEFMGWYSGSLLLSSAKKYSFEITSDKSLTAKFQFRSDDDFDPDDYIDPDDKGGSVITPAISVPVDDNGNNGGDDNDIIDIVKPDNSTKTDSRVLISDFVDRIYLFVLDRDPEKDGAKFWSDELYNFRRTGAEVAQGFIFSPEFEGRKTSDEDFIKILYRTFFNRLADKYGLKFWLDQLQSGAKSRKDVANDFIFSQEWADTCATYGIRSGGELKPAIAIEPTDLTYSFVERMYTTCMARNYDQSGREYWADQLANFSQTGEACGASFFLSDEFVGFNLSNEEFISRLYRTFMNREADADGMNYWLSVLNTQPRSNVVYGFTRSKEFVNNCVEARILPY